MATPPGATSRRERRTARRAARRRKVVRRALVALPIAALLAGGAITAGAVLRDDGGEAGRSAATTAAEVTTTTEAPTTTTAARDPRRGSGQPVTFAFGGDSHFEGALRSRLQADPVGMLAPIAPVLSSADLAVVNLETAIAERGVPADKPFTFRTPATALTALAAAGIDVASVANNHGVDYGPEGLADTLAVKAATPSPAIIGVGNNAAEAYAPFRIEIKGQRIAIFGATQVLDDHLLAAWTATDAQAGLASAKDVPRLVAAVQAARADSDTIIVHVHWGIEGQQCPSPDQQALAQALVDAGADIVVGGHAHRLQGAGRLGSAFVDYGMGNFIWYNESGINAVSGVLFVTATGRDIDGYSWQPAVIRGGVPQPTPPGPQADQAIGAWNDLRGCTGLAP